MGASGPASPRKTLSSPPARNARAHSPRAQEERPAGAHVHSVLGRREERPAGAGDPGGARAARG